MGVKLSVIAKAIEGTVYTCKEYLDNEVEYGFSSDLMSDVLTIDREDVILITGLNNIQTIRTCELAEIKYVIYARNKMINTDIIKLANENKILVIQSPYSVFKVSGILYNLGVKPIY
ncbi:MAG TPA: DRTGG domain-containing protein [Bacteroidales bacterium]|nr:DRTGG domain-containing protein [Bacteroidales bacterium]HOF07705.1 DRTGG domain-containing protein [Bacteroidales bacterium]HOS21007.1 DRTGG domain-containing protein [Bacteroidales bacterium]HOU82847.1 DRTGG domain-containing protein [Bacteroidales bacterium]HPL03095.1 DRTGG domain-containing protein [Bacteroidales bacterium]